jgi:putative ABC transport system substrate-binding protein
MKRREFITLLSGPVALPLTALLPSLLAATSSLSANDKSPVRIGWLKIQGVRHTPGQLQAFREGMRAHGLIEGRDYVLEERYADGDESRLPGLAAELLKSGVSIIVATSQPSIAAAGRLTKDVPVIGRMVDDPVSNGMARSMARPGGNVTGIYTMTEEMNPKRLALLKEVAPSVRRVGVLLRNDFPNKADVEHAWQVEVAAARRLELELRALDARSGDEVTAAIQQAAAQNVDGLITFRNPTVVTYLKRISELCRTYRLPAVFDAREYVEAGGLMSYGPNIDATYSQLAGYVAKLLHGASPGELPIEQPTTFEMLINRDTAKALGLTIPPTLLLAADKVIE